MGRKRSAGIHLWLLLQGDVGAGVGLLLWGANQVPAEYRNSELLGSSKIESR